MLSLVTDGPGWTDDTTFFKWVKEGSEPRLIGINSGSGMPIIFTKQSFDDAVAALTTLGDWRNEDDGTNNYIEGDAPDLFDINDFDEDEDEFFEWAEEFDNVYDYLEQLGYNSEDDEEEDEEDEENEEDLYYYDEAVDYIESQGVSADPGNPIGEYVCDRLDWDADGSRYGDSYFYKETLDNIIKRAKEKYAEEIKDEEN